MKNIFALSFLLLFLSACQKASHSDKDNQDTVEVVMDTFPKATAIFLDKDENYKKLRKNGPVPIRTIKAKVNIDSLGKIELFSYTKPLSKILKSYIEYRLNIFRIKTLMLDSGYVKPGVQYVQLRYMPYSLNAYR